MSERKARDKQTVQRKEVIIVTITIKEAERLLKQHTGQSYKISTGPEYPKQYMTRRELLEMGAPITPSLLDRAEAYAGEKVCRKNNPLARNSKYIYNTEEFEKWRKSH